MNAPMIEPSVAISLTFPFALARWSWSARSAMMIFSDTQDNEKAIPLQQSGCHQASHVFCIGKYCHRDSIGELTGNEEVLTPQTVNPPTDKWAGHQECDCEDGAKEAYLTCTST